MLSSHDPLAYGSHARIAGLAHSASRILASRQRSTSTHHTIAYIRFTGGMLMLPSRTPYEIETLFETLTWYAMRYHAIQFELARHHWRVEHGTVPKGSGCAQCGGARAVLTFVNGIRVPVCARCARVGVGSAFAHWPHPELSRAS